ncbi:MAG: hypothetical protein DMG14_08210 [Acidobacteria bacterium]|nr:MAG: hypothetical protein DMG14_08210 [Acidobacteriota bacterium]
MSRTRDSSGFVDIGNAAFDVSTTRNHFHAALHHRFIEDGGELFPDFVFLAVNPVDQANDDFGSRWNCPRGVRRV